MNVDEMKQPSDFNGVGVSSTKRMKFENCGCNFCTGVEDKVKKRKIDERKRRKSTKSAS